jgi:hypothetical protein
MDLCGEIEKEGFYLPRRRLTSSPTILPSGLPVSGAAFGRAAPLEVPTPQVCGRTRSNKQ